MHKWFCWGTLFPLVAAVACAGCSGGQTYRLLAPDAMITTASAKTVSHARLAAYEALGKHAAAGRDATRAEKGRYWSGERNAKSGPALVRSEAAFELHSGSIVRIESVGGDGLPTIVFVNAARKGDAMAVLDKIAETLETQGVVRAD